MRERERRREVQRKHNGAGRGSERDEANLDL